MDTKTRRNRAETEHRLIDVALDLILNNGVLAGLNLREVADGAGVNRGNIYHYFGSRRELLRAAITRRFEAVAELCGGRQAGPLLRRAEASGTFRSSATIHDSQLRALLVIDGDDTVDPMPRYEAALSRLRQDVIDGDIDRGHDLEALQVALSALIRGYRIFREQYAKRIDTDAGDLDERVAEIVRAWLEAMAGAAGGQPARRRVMTNEGHGREELRTTAEGIAADSIMDGLAGTRCETILSTRGSMSSEEARLRRGRLGRADQRGRCCGMQRAVFSAGLCRMGIGWRFNGAGRSSLAPSPNWSRLVDWVPPTLTALRAAGGVSETLGYNGIQTSSLRSPAFPRGYGRRLGVRVPSAPPLVPGFAEEFAF